MTEKEEFNRIHIKLDNINQRLFVDNGKPCIQTRLDRTERILKVVLWIGVIMFGTVITQVTKDVIDILHSDEVLTVEASK